MTRLDAALDGLAAALAPVDARWWLIGSAAVHLHGADAGPVADLDLLCAAADAPALAARLGLPLAPGQADDRFCSTLFGRGGALALPVELMAGLALRAPGGAWQPLSIPSRLAIRPGLFVPDRADLAALLDRFDRPKDRRRAAALRG